MAESLTSQWWVATSIPFLTCTHVLGPPTSMIHTKKSFNRRNPEHYNTIQFDIEEETAPAQHIPRAWERVPKSSHATRHKGRTVWKRAEARTGSANNNSGNTEDANVVLKGDERLALGDISTNTPRGVKKQRLHVGKEGKGKEGETSEKGRHYLVTSRDVELATPRSKWLFGVYWGSFADGAIGKQRHLRKSGLFPTLARQKSPAKRKSTQIQRTESPKPETRRELHPIEARSTLPTTEVTQPEEAMLIEETLNNAPQEQGQIVDEPSIIGGTAHTLAAPQLLTTETQGQTSPSKLSSPIKAPPSVVNSVSPRKRGRPRKSEATPVAFKFVATSTPAVIAQAIPSTVTELKHEDATPVKVAATPQNARLILDGLPTPTSRLTDLNSPQIGTTLLRRESMRRKSSPGKRLSARGKSPRKKQLKKRDTLQERDILQKFSEEEASQNGIQEPPLSVAQAEVALTLASPVLGTNEGQGPPVSVGGDKIPAEVIAEVILDNKDFQRAVEAIEVFQDVESSESGGSMSPKSSDEEKLAEANEVIAKAELDEAHEAIVEVCEKAELPLRKTRSGIRFSDDTSMLKDFLSRAQANKAAKTTTLLSPKVPKSLQVSPKRSPRKRNGSAPPAKAQTSAPRVNKSKLKASPNKAKLEMTFGDDLEEEGAAEPELELELESEAVTCRRSTRARLPAPQKTPPIGPSLIPVRRADGADPVVLQKTQAQELAIVTRANTRRNKGQARPPQMALRDLSVEEVDDTVTIEKQGTRKGTGKAKAVAWAETLAHYQGAKEIPEAAEEKPKVRRLRGLGGVNGTPAAKKKTAPAAPSNGTPAPKRRAKLTG